MSSVRDSRGDWLEQVHRLMRTIAEEPDASRAVQLGLAAACDSGGWRYAEVRLPRPDGHVLEQGPYHATSASYQGLAEASRRWACPIDGTLPGRVWGLREAQWCTDLTSAPDGLLVEPAASGSPRSLS